MCRTIQPCVDTLCVPGEDWVKFFESYTWAGISDVEPIEILRVVLDIAKLDEIVKPMASDFDVHRILLHHINEDDELVKKAVTPPSQEIQEEEDEEEDLEEVEAVAEGKSDGDIPVPASPRTLVAGQSVSSRSHETRLALLEASVLDLEDRVLLVNCDMWARFDEIKSILASHTTDMEIITREARSTRHHYNNLVTSYRQILWDWRHSFITKMTELTSTQDQMTDLVLRTAFDVIQTCDIFINNDTDLRPSVENWVK
ncbi:hypothetical protein CJ030_MR7G005998 [Morella rubra]|uniref:Uncharacterized protein n=1 Tax=Morella rubra TaxID=262757 RepID=A0A6A1V084_9ROSI|nr:hypothetical protein CJ030_MR7G005998 [Morella rubra]